MGAVRDWIEEPTIENLRVALEEADCVRAHLGADAVVDYLRVVKYSHEMEFKEIVEHELGVSEYEELFRAIGEELDI